MHPFVVAAFHGRAAAEAALERLRASNIATRTARLHDTTPDARNAAALEFDEVASGGFFGNARELLHDLLDTPSDPENAVDFDELVKREATLVSVSVDSQDAARQVRELLEASGAKRVSTLPQAGLES